MGMIGADKMQPAVAKKLDTYNPIDNVSLETLQSAVSSSRSPLIITDNLLPDNPIIYCNQAFIDLIGYIPEDVIGKNCRFLQGPDTDAVTVAKLRTAVQANEYVRVLIKNYRKNGEAFWNDLVMSPVRDQAGQTTHFVGMQLDVTDLIETRERLEARSVQLEQSNHELEQFTYATSHDLQEPLRMISSYLQLLSQRYGNKIDDDGKTFIGYAVEGAERMQALIDDLLTLSRVSTTSDKFRETDIADTIARAEFNLHMQIKDVGGSIAVGPMPKLPVDPVQITSLFQNLISNALKYQQPGVAPAITISAEEAPEAWVFTVADNGIGIVEKDLKRIFIVFQRLHTRAEYSGTGIGLAICDKIIERHGGKIWAESQVGTGSAFKFKLPKTHKGDES